MTSEGRPKHTRLEDPIDEETEVFKRFIKEHRCTADQMREAYYRLLGISENKTEIPNVGLIYTEMQRMVDNRFPLNRFASLIESRQDFEDAVPMYHNFVEGLDISDNEKKVLRSIIDREREGEIVCLVGNQIVAEFKVHTKSLGKSIAVAVILKNIRNILEQIPRGKKYEFTFSEL
jgi:hypothetical protein